MNGTTLDTSSPSTPHPADKEFVSNTTRVPPTTPFDSSMTLTILILLTALFFMGFFSIYLRRSAAAVAVANYRSSSPSRRPPPVKPNVGLDPSAVSSLPVVVYGKSQTQTPTRHHHTTTVPNNFSATIEDCTICLSEFAEGESVKLIPNCGHVFHPKCVDTWLSSHVTCPLCRSDQLFGRGGGEVCLDVARCRDDGCGTSAGEGSTWRDHIRT